MLRLHLEQVVSNHRRRLALGLDFGDEGLEDGGLARSGLADQIDKLARLDVEGDLREDHQLTLVDIDIVQGDDIVVDRFPGGCGGRILRGRRCGRGLLLYRLLGSLLRGFGLGGFFWIRHRYWRMWRFVQ